MYGAACGSWASHQVGRPGEAVHKYTDTLEYAFFFPACCLLLLLELLIQLLILLLHIRPEAVLGCSVKRHGDTNSFVKMYCGALINVSPPLDTGQ